MAALPSLRQLSYLVTLSETLHFTEAARRSFVTQSTLSGGIMELERLLGGVLVERDRQNVRLSKGLLLTRITILLLILLFKLLSTLLSKQNCVKI
jgi:DNA-binding transcriptional LysR family regulator